MGLFEETVLRKIGKRAALAKGATERLAEDARITKSTQSFDVFLSHSLKDADVILGIKTVLESKRLSVYVDWVEDPQLDRGSVSPETAKHLRTRMQQSKSLIYAHSNNSPASKWMPWELGYFDGRNGAIAVFPIIKMPDEKFDGQEFLGLYPYIDYVNQFYMFINKGRAPRYTLGNVKQSEDFTSFEDWMRDRAKVVIAG